MKVYGEFYGMRVRWIGMSSVCCEVGAAEIRIYEADRASLI